MNKQRKVIITTTYNEMGIIIDTKAEELGSSAQLGTDTISRQAAIMDAESWVAADEYEKHLQKKVVEWLKEFPPAELGTNLAEGGTRAEVRAQPPVQPRIPDKIIKELTQMSNALDCQTPCTDMFPSDWCRTNCQWKAPQEQCWRRWAEKEMSV